MQKANSGPMRAVSLRGCHLFLCQSVKNLETFEPKTRKVGVSP